MGGLSGSSSCTYSFSAPLKNGVYEVEIESKKVDMERKVFSCFASGLSVDDKVRLKETIGGWLTGRECVVRVLGKKEALFGLYEYEFSEIESGKG